MFIDLTNVPHLVLVLLECHLQYTNELLTALAVAAVLLRGL